MKIYKKPKKHPWGYDIGFVGNLVGFLIFKLRGGMMDIYLLGTFLQTKWQVIKKTTIHKITMLVKKGQHSVPPF